MKYYIFRSIDLTAKVPKSQTFKDFKTSVVVDRLESIGFNFFAGNMPETYEYAKFQNSKNTISIVINKTKNAVA